LKINRIKLYGRVIVEKQFEVRRLFWWTNKNKNKILPKEFSDKWWIRRETPFFDFVLHKWDSKSYEDYNSCKNIRTIEATTKNEQEQLPSILTDHIREFSKDSEIRGNTELTLLDNYENPMNDLSDDEENKNRHELELHQTDEEWKDMSITPLTPKFIEHGFIPIRNSEMSLKNAKLAGTQRFRNSGFNLINAKQRYNKLKTLKNKLVHWSVEVVPKYTRKIEPKSELNPSLSSNN